MVLLLVRPAPKLWFATNPPLHIAVSVVVAQVEQNNSILFRQFTRDFPHHRILLFAIVNCDH